MRNQPYFVVLCFLSLFFTVQTDAQNEALITPDGYGVYQQETVSCLHPEQRESIKEELRQAVDLLGLDDENPLAFIKFIWPVRAAEHMTDPSFYGISHFVDHDNVFSGSHDDNVQDYNCGNRAYDMGNGYNHPGTDIFLWPLPWHKVNNNSVEAIAAAAGTILSKTDGNDHTSCNLCLSCMWNAVYIAHDDGSITWYGHLKKNSLTAKAVGERVEQGEFLGIVASSGNSTGPHLHFEVYADQDMDILVDPYDGSCNSLNANTSWWEEQKPYREPTLNKILIGTAPVEETGCPNMAITNETTNLMPGDSYTLTLFFHDQMDGDMVSLRILRPDGSTFSNWSSMLSGETNGSYWFWNRTLAANAESGDWTVIASYYDQVEEYVFHVGESASAQDTKSQKQACQMNNPFAEALNIQCTGMQQIATLRLMDVHGKTLLQKNNINNPNDFYLNTSNMETGIYFLVIEDKNGRFLESRKLLKQK